MRDQESGKLDKAMQEWKNTVSMINNDIEDCPSIVQNAHDRIR